MSNTDDEIDKIYKDDHYWRCEQDVICERCGAVVHHSVVHAKYHDTVLHPNALGKYLDEEIKGI